MSQSSIFHRFLSYKKLWKLPPKVFVKKLKNKIYKEKGGVMSCGLHSELSC